ncbi:type VI secretion system effector, Hcp1 family [Xenorhabdus mauleonii]|uniref:Type VI secretion system effector, Hcp1 family n=1 Tax=Xenorhabdus mauleonii TaxID=351675 RepID=A0A1I3MGN7_9GAMM|nr:type VI secretion system tube protein Hcp [Xenorhabdus mauleonii]PHM45510.1 type VI secretion system effector, Hcp1 family [Xenorhabdus mauleonii]SFI96189.1 type VI secretion system secreted protein Hcp [Xenorhabdus mauleonii]
MSTGTDAYIQFSSITGESKDEKHSGWTAVRSFSLNLTNSVNRNRQTGGLGAGLVGVSDLVVDIVFDKSAISLRQYLVKGTHIKDTKLNIRRQGGEQEPWYALELTNALMADSRVVFGDGFFHSQIVIAFQTFKESYFPQKDEGGKDAEIHYKWDTFTNKLE